MTVTSVLPDYQTTPANLSDETIQSYRSQGFVHIPGIISKQEAETFGEEANALPDRVNSYSNSRVFTQLVNVWRNSDIMKKLTLHPNVGAIAERLAGIPLRLWHDHILIKQPHNEAPTEFHQDRPYWPFIKARHTLSAWIALVDVPVERGCMTFIPGSQQYDNLRPQDLRNAHDFLSLAPDLTWTKRVTVPLRAGDCTFHSGLCAHMATPNFTDDPRIAHVVIFMDAESTYSGNRHPVTDPLNLTEGQLLDGEMFPHVGASRA